jgi:predicted ATPase
MELINAIRAIKLSRGLKNYVDFIKFPFYRNLEINTTIKFDFPLTVLIGQNGCGKSSCLHALYGMPKGYTPYEFWFDTSVDPIEYYDDKKKRHSFWYSYTDNNDKIREVLKARIRRNDDPNYWETSRPLIWAGMTPRKDNLRDEPLEKNVVYIDFRAELSSFDKFFYFGSLKGASTKSKQEFIRKKSKQLQSILSGQKAFINTKAGPINKPIKFLNSLELKWISFILGKNYLSGEFLEHSFFRNFGYSVIFKTDYAKYSEAFAGSGEVAIVRLVLKILEAPLYSLILLDEPEVSLHPGAQSRLLIFLLEQIKIKKHQVVITSHSPSLVNGLPKEAIKVFYQNPSNGKFLVKENLTPKEAFYHIEFPIDEKLNIIVEDILAKEIIEGVLGEIGNHSKNLFNVKFNPGGASVIKKEFITVYCRDNSSKNYIFFDGDQKPIVTHTNWKDLSTSEITTSNFKRIISEQIGINIKFSVDSNGNKGNDIQQLELLKLYLDYFLTKVNYLPKNIPEEIIWSDEYAQLLIQGIMPDQTKIQEIVDQLVNLNGCKEKFSYMSNLTQGNNDANSISSVHRLFLQRWLNSKNDNFLEIEEALKKILEMITSS